MQFRKNPLFSFRRCVEIRQREGAKAVILNEQSMELVNLVKEFVDNEIIPHAAEYEKKNEFPE